MGKGLRGSFDSPMTKKALSLGIMFIFLLTLAGLGVLGGAELIVRNYISAYPAKHFMLLLLVSVTLKNSLDLVQNESEKLTSMHNHWHCHILHGFQISKVNTRFEL